MLSLEEEGIIVAFRKHTLLPLDDCLYALQPTIPNLTRSSLHRCLQRHGISFRDDLARFNRRTKRASKTQRMLEITLDIFLARMHLASLK